MGEREAVLSGGSERLRAVASNAAAVTAAAAAVREVWALDVPPQISHHMETFNPPTVLALLDELDAAHRGLAQAAAWIAETLGYPVNFTTDEPMPDALWAALVDHVHADRSGKWHGNELDREHVESWLADEAGRDLAASSEQGRAEGEGR